MQTAFDHLNGYSAVYYTYMWSLVISKDIITRFNKEGIDELRIGNGLRKQDTGGQRHRTRGRNGKGFSGPAIFVRGLCGLAERKMRIDVGRSPLVVG